MRGDGAFLCAAEMLAVHDERCQHHLFHVCWRPCQWTDAALVTEMIKVLTMSQTNFGGM